eukprot:6910941-Prymnesium_polylepis.1
MPAPPACPRATLQASLAKRSTGVKITGWSARRHTRPAHPASNTHRPTPQAPRACASGPQPTAARRRKAPLWPSLEVPRTLHGNSCFLLLLVALRTRSRLEGEATDSNRHKHGTARIALRLLG